MARRDIHPDMPDRDRGRFRHATNRRIELTLRKELDDVGKKSVMDIHAAKEARLREPLEEPVKTMR